MAGRKKGTGTPELCCLSVFTFGLSKSFPKSNRQIHMHVAKPAIPSEAGRDGIKGKGKK